MNEFSEITVSPCISICKTDSITGFCFGCTRINEEKKIWEEEKTTNNWKKENLIMIVKRMPDWQLESFDDSYRYKNKNGISLFKKNLIKKIKNNN